MAEKIDPQRLAAESAHQNLLVVAPPGCGKTELLAMRAAALIPRLKTNQRILALTFTNRAKANLNDRLRRLLGPQRFRRYVQVHNFHGHATDIIRSHGRTLGLNPAELVFPTTQTLRKALQQFSSNANAIRTAEKLLGEVKRHLRDDDQVAEALATAGDALAARVEAHRIACNHLHYDDLLRHAQRLLHIDEIANLYQQHYGAVLVDEFQDLSLQQLDVVLKTCQGSRTFAGDPLQGIYSWAGAAPKEVEEDLRACCAEPIQLTVSHRSSPAVLTMVNSIALRMGAKPLQAYDPTAWPDGGASAALTTTSYEHEAEVISALAERIVKADPSASVGVISRAGWRRGQIDKAFANLPDVPFRRWDLAIEDPMVLERIRRVVAGLPHAATVAEARVAVVAAIDPSDVDTVEDTEDAFDHIETEADPDDNVRVVLDRFRHAVDDETAVGPGVHLLNAHTGKGQQFDWVFICGLEEGHLPGKRNSSGPALEEEERVLLVMLSRARHGVVVTRSTSAVGWYGPYQLRPSRWFAELQAAATMDEQTFLAHLEAMYPKRTAD